MGGKALVGAGRLLHQILIAVAARGDWLAGFRNIAAAEAVGIAGIALLGAGGFFGVANLRFANMVGKVHFPVSRAAGFALRQFHAGSRTAGMCFDQCQSAFPTDEAMGSITLIFIGFFAVRMFAGLATESADALFIAVQTRISAELVGELDGRIRAVGITVVNRKPGKFRIALANGLVKGLGPVGDEAVEHQGNRSGIKITGTRTLGSVVIIRSCAAPGGAADAVLCNIISVGGTISKIKAVGNVAAGAGNTAAIIQIGFHRTDIVAVFQGLITGSRNAAHPQAAADITPIVAVAHRTIVVAHDTAHRFIAFDGAGEVTLLHSAVIVAHDAAEIGPGIEIGIDQPHIKDGSAGIGKQAEVLLFREGAAFVVQSGNGVTLAVEGSLVGFGIASDAAPGSPGILLRSAAAGYVAGIDHDIRRQHRVHTLLAAVHFSPEPVELTGIADLVKAVAVGIFRGLHAAAEGAEAVFVSMAQSLAVLFAADIADRRAAAGGAAAGVARSFHIIVHIAVAAGAGIGGIALLRAGGLRDHGIIAVGMPRSIPGKAVGTVVLHHILGPGGQPRRVIGIRLHNPLECVRADGRSLTGKGDRFQQKAAKKALLPDGNKVLGEGDLRQRTAAVERIVADIRQRRREGYVCQAGTAIECHNPDGGDPLRDVHFSQCRAIIECIVRNLGNAPANGHRGQAGAFGEYALADGGNTVCNGNLCQSRAAPECFDTQRSHIPGDGQLRQAAAVSKGHISDAGHAVGNGDLRQAFAAIERVSGNIGKALGNFKIRQTGAVIERIGAHSGHTARKLHRVQRRTLREGIFADFVHTLGRRKYLQRIIPGQGILADPGQMALHADACHSVETE